MFLMANPPQVWHQQCLSTEIGRTFRTTEIFVFNHYFFFSRWQLNSLNELKMVKKNCCWMERSNWEGVFKCSVTNWHSGSQLTAAATPFRSHKKRASTEVQPPDNMSNIKSNILGSCCIQAIIHTYIYILICKKSSTQTEKKSIAIINRHFHCHLYEQRGYNRPSTHQTGNRYRLRK